MTPSWKTLSLLAALPLCTFALTARATTVMALDVPALTRGSELVLRGHVLSATPHQSPGSGRILTEVEVSVGEVLTGSTRERSFVKVLLPGGSVGELRQHVGGTPRLEPGEEVVLFLGSEGREGRRVVGMAQGAFHVRSSEGTHDALARTEFDEQLQLVDPLSLQPVPTAPRELSLRTLRAQVLSAARGMTSSTSPIPHAQAAQDGSVPPAVRTRAPVSESAPEGHCLYWSGGQTLTFHSQQCAATEPDCAARQSSVGLAIRNWDDALASCTSLRLAEGRATASRQVGYVREGPNENVILLRDRTCAPDSGASGDRDCWEHSAETLGLTTVTFQFRTGQVLDADLELNAAAVYSQGGSSWLQAIVVHELGHALGLDHSPDPRSTMYATQTPGQSTSSTPDEGSRQALCAIYPPGAPAVDCVETVPGSQPPLESRGCSSAPGWSGLGLLGLMRFIARASRRRGQGLERKNGG